MKLNKQKIQGVILICIPIVAILLAYYYFSLIFTPKPSYNTICRITKSEIKDLNYIADYYYNLGYDNVLNYMTDPIEIIHVQSNNSKYSEEKIKSPEIIKKTKKYFDLSRRTWYRGFSSIMKYNECVLFSKWSTRDAGIYVVYSPLGEEKISSNVDYCYTIEIIPLGIDNWYYCYLE